MSYSSDSFLKPIGSDKSIRFFDNDGNLTFTLKPTFITNVTSDANLLKVTLKSGKLITLDFINFDDTILAQSKLQQQISTLLQTNDYVDNSTQGVVGYVTAPFSYSTFLRPITESDRNIKIMGVDLIVKYTIDPFYIINTNVSNNLLKISLKSNKSITLEFSTSNEAKLALIRLKEQVDILTEKTPLIIDKSVNNYIDSKIFSGATGPTGPAGMDGQDGIVGGQLFYFNESVTGYTASYKELGNNPIASDEQVVTTILGPAQSDVLVSSYISDSLGLTVIPSGIQRFNLHYKKGETSSISTYAVVQLADINGTKYYDYGFTQAIAYSNTTPIDWIGDIPTNINLDIISLTTAIQSTDRIVISLYANNLDSITQSVSFYTQGSNNYSYVQTSTAVVPGPQGPQGDPGQIGPIGPQGDPGQIGPTGPQGIQGFQGVEGIQGIKGATGSQGIQGVDGPQGIQGIQGFQGVKGPTGPQGVAGPQGFQGVDGPEGPHGPTGPEGPQGPQGNAGFGIEFQGQLGSTASLPQPSTQGFAYLINNVLWIYDSFGHWVDGGNIQGPQGTQGNQGVDGPEGPHGPTGPEGPIGATGSQGIQGIQGATGPQGPIGITGSQGIQGIQGIQGPYGPTGPQGIQGIQGSSGTSGLSGVNGIDGTSGTSGISGATGIGVTSSFYLKGGTSSAYDTTSDIYRTGYLNIGTGTATDGRFVVSAIAGSVSFVVDDNGSVYNRSKGITNTVFGYQALQLNINGINNTAIGYQSLANNTSGVSSLTSLVSGTGYTPGTYSNVQLTYLSGSTASTYPTAQIVVRSGGTVSTVTLASNGTGFRDTTTIMSASFSGTGASFSIKVNSLVSGISNTAIGFYSLNTNRSGSYNTAVGQQSLLLNTSGSSNTAIGYQSLLSNTNGGSNIAIGFQSLSLNTIGVSNTAVGYQSLYNNTTGFSNTAIGSQTLYWNTSGYNNIAVGLQSLYNNTTGSSNTAIGNNSLSQNTTGISNTAIGYYSLNANRTGSYNTAVGQQSLLLNTSGSSNTAIGTDTLFLNTTGYYNTAIGYGSMLYNTTGNSNTALGYQSLYSNTTGALNTALGHQSLYTNTTGNNNTALGQQSLYSNTTGYSNTALGLQSLYSNTTGYYNTAIGLQSLSQNTSGYYNIAIGYASMLSNTTGFDNTAIGNGSLENNTTGYQNTAIGNSSLQYNTTGYNNTAIGRLSLFSNTTGYSNTSIGNQALYSNTTGYENVAIGFASLSSNTTGNYNTALGFASLLNNTTGVNNTALGYQSLQNNTTGYENTALGYASLSQNTSGYSNTAIGFASLINNETGYENTSLGKYSLPSNTTGYYNTSIGYGTLWYNFTGYSNTAIGYKSLYSNTTGFSNTTIGKSALYSNTTGYYNTAIGQESLYYNTTGFSNTSLGQESLSSNTTGYYNTALGFQSLYYNTTGSQNTAIGYESGFIYQNNSNSVFIGYGSYAQADDQTNQIVIGYNTIGNGSNTVTLGNNDIIRTYLKGSVVIADGTQGAGKFLTSDANGLASWTSVGAGSGATGPQGATGLGSVYSATSSTEFTTPEVGFMRTIQTQTNLAYTQDQWVIISSNSDFGEDEYYEEFTSPLFYAKVDDYNPTTGVLNVISEYSADPGLTFSQWFINLSGANSPGVIGATGATGSGTPANYHIPDAEYTNYLYSTWYFNIIGEYSFSVNDIVIIRDTVTNLIMIGRVVAYNDVGAPYFQMAVSATYTEPGFESVIMSPGSANPYSINLTGLPVSPTPTYKVFTALLTQSGGDSPNTAYGDGTFYKGVTYTIVSNPLNEDATFYGAPNNNDGTSFICNQTISPGQSGSFEFSFNDGAPVATVLENTIGNIWFNVGLYNAFDGIYGIMSDNLFTENKTTSEIEAFYNNEADGVAIPIINYSLSNYLEIVSRVGDSPHREIGTGGAPTKMEIRVYN